MSKSQTITIDSYELKESRQGPLVPSINGVHLHSSYNPEREAEVFVDKNIKTLESKRNILILGLGLGYNLQKITEQMIKLYESDFKIFVIEPIHKLFEDAQRLKVLPVSKNIFYYTTDDLDKLYRQEDILEFLVSKPGIVIHPASFNFNRPFFEGFLKYRPSQSLKTSKDLPLKPDVIDYLSRFNQDESLKESAEEVRRQDQVSGLDHVLLCLQSFRKEEVKNQHGNTMGEV